MVKRLNEKEDLATAALLEFLNAAEAGIAAAKHVISKGKGIEKWNPDKIKWTQAQGSKGPYERSEDVNNLEFKAMLKELGSHSGKIQRNGFFYWTFQNGHTVGRKRRK